MSLLRESGERTLTIAPETGSDRLRRVINKTVTNEEILDAAELIFSSGIENLKLYFMIGLPTEDDEDLVAIRDLTVQLRDIMMKHARARGRIGRIVGSVNPLVPKPGTAYQWLPMAPTGLIESKMERLRALVSRHRQRLLLHQERAAFLLPGAALARRSPHRAGRGSWRSRTAVSGGGRWPTPAWTVTSTSIAIDRTIPVLPWDIIDGGMKAAFFRAEFEKSQRAEWTLPPKRAKENARLLPMLA